MANDKIVPVVIKLTTENDGSLDSAVAQSVAKLKAIEGQTVASIGDSIAAAADKAGKAVQRAIRPETMQIFSERALSQTITAINEINAKLSESSGRFVSLSSQAQAAFDAGIIAKDNDAIVKLNTQAGLLAASYKAVAAQLQNQKDLADKLSGVAPADYVQAKAQVQSAQILTTSLQKEADLIKKSYEDAFDAVKNKIKEVSVAQEKALKEADRLAAQAEKKTDTVAAPVNISTTRQELDLIRIRGQIVTQQTEAEKRRNILAVQLLDTEKQIQLVKNAELKDSLSSRFTDTGNLNLKAIDTRKQAATELANVEKAVEEQIKVIRAGGSQDQIKALKLSAEQSRVTASLLIADARKIEAEYKTSFGKLAADAEKAGREIVDNVKNPKVTGSSANSAFGFLAPITNQLAGLTDSFIGSLGSKLGFLRTTVGTQLGLSIGRGVSDGLNSVDLSENNVARFLKSLDEPSKQLIANIGSGIVVACAAASAAIGGLIVSVTQVAGKFEGFIAQLTTSFKDPTIAVERFKEAVEIAGKTPFDVEQVVRAQVSLAARGEKSLQVLKDVTELAAAQNKDLNETAIAVGHATEGSIRGYEQLRNSYGVTVARLKEFGAVVNDQNQILLHNEYQISRNKEALLQLIRTDFGGGVERLSRTLQGLQSNLRDEVTKLSASFGEVYLPTMKVATEATTALVKAIGSMPQELKITLAGAVAAAGGFAALVTSLGATYLGVTQVQKAIQGLLLVDAVKNLSTLNASLTATSFILGGVGKAVGFIVSILPELAALTAVVVALSAAAKVYEEDQVSVGDQIKETSKALAEARRTTAGLNEDLIKTFKLPPQFKVDIQDANNALSQVREALAAKGKLGVASDLSAQGVTEEDLVKQNEVKQKSQEKLLDNTNKLKEAYYQLSEAQKAGSFKKEELVTVGYVATVRELDLTLGDIIKKKDTLEKVKVETGFDSGTIVNASNINEIMNSIVNHSNEAARGFSALGIGIDIANVKITALKETSDAYGKIAKGFTEAEAFTKFAEKAKDADLLRAALIREGEAYEKIVAEIKRTQGVTEVTSESMAVLAASSNKAAQSIAQAFFKSRESILALRKLQEEQPNEENKKEIEDIELTLAYKLATTKKNEHEIRLAALNEEQQRLDGSYEAYKRYSAVYLFIKAQLDVAVNASDKERLRSQLEFLQIRIDALRSAAKEEVKVIKDTAQEEEAIRRNTVSHTKDAIKDLIASIKQQASGEQDISKTGSFGFDGDKQIEGLGKVKKSIQEAGTEALTADQKLKVYQKGLANLNDITSRPDIVALRAQSTELDAALREAKRTLEEGVVKANIEKPIENFKRLKEAIGESVSGSTNLAERLKNIDAAELALRNDQRSGSINNKDAQKEILELEKQRHETQKGITAAVAAQAVELSKLRDKDIANEIQILELKKQTSQGSSQIAEIESAILNRKRQQVQAQFQDIAAEREKELSEKNSGKDRDLILLKYSEKEAELIKASYIAYAKGEDDKLKAFQDRLKSEQAEVDKYKEKRVGGKNSPLISLEELGFQSTLPGFGSDLYADKSQPFDGALQYNLGSTRPGGGQLLTYEQYKAKFLSDNRAKPNAGNSTLLPGVADNIQKITPAVNNATYNTYINGNSSTDKEIAEKAADLTKFAISKSTSKNNLLSGPTSGTLGKPTSLGVGEYPKLNIDPAYPSSYNPGNY